MPRVNIQVTDPVIYNHGYNGTALKALILRDWTPGEPLDAFNFAARAMGLTYTVATPVTQADEINVTHVQETNYGRQELVTGRFDSVFCLKIADQMPSFQTLRTEKELIVLETTGDDHEYTTSLGKLVILGAIVGVRFISQSTNTMVNQQKVFNVDFVGRKRYLPAEWKLLTGDVFAYPATVTP